MAEQDDDQPVEKNKGGAPTSYRPEYPEQARKLAQLGATDREIAEFFEVAEWSVNRWKTRHPEFAAAITVGKEAPDNRVERSLYQRAVGFEYTEQQAIKVKIGPHEERVEVVDVTRVVLPETVACIFWLKNRRKAEWRDKIDHEVSGGLTVNISGPEADL